MPAFASSMPPAPDQASRSELWEPSTVRLRQADSTVLQALTGTDQQHACLILYSGEDAGKRFALPGGRMLMGRSPSCDICIDSPGVSRSHAELLLEGDHFMLHLSLIHISEPTRPY